MPRACSFLCVFGDRQLLLLSLSLPVELLCRSRKKHIAATIDAVSTESWTTPMMKVFLEIQKKNLLIFQI